MTEPPPRSPGPWRDHSPRPAEDDQLRADVRDACDFPAEHYERDWVGRFTYDQLNETGRRCLGSE